MTVEFRLLGDVDALVDGRRVETGHARQRSVLAALLVEVNRPVPAEQLIERVWADRPPHRARNALSAYLSRLRQQLAGAADVRIARGPGGYQLSVDPMAVDLHRFRRLVGQARAAGDPVDSAAMYRDALDLWRGEPFPTVDTPWFAAVRTSLHAERLAVQLDRNDVQLRAGGHAELVGELADAVRAHPLDERLAGQLMLAQFRSGRQADALDTYRRIRGGLLEELGADPGVALRRVHQQILEGDAEGAAVPAPTGPPMRAPAPTRPSGNLPRRATGFVGRESEVALVVAAVRDARLVTLTGVGGVGKSRLAVEAAAHEQVRFPDGEWLCELAPLPDDALGVEGERIVPLAPLPAQDGSALFVARARSGRPDFRLDGDEAAAVAEICRRLDGLPLAIELAAARMRVMNAVEVARRLDSGRFLSRGTRGALPHHQSLDATVDWSYRLLSDAEKALFARLSVFAGGFDLDAAHGVCGEPGAAEIDTLDLLGGLVDKSMVTVLSTSGRSRYGVLETLRAYGRERLREAGVDSAIGRAHATYFAQFAGQVARELHGRAEGTWAERALPDYDNLRTAFERAVADGDGELAVTLVTSVSELVHVRVGYESGVWAQRALDLVDAHHPLAAATVGAAARGAWNRGEFAAARIVAERAAGQVPGRGADRVAYPADVLADVALYEGDADAALRHYTGEVERARREDDPIRLVWTLYYVAVCHAVLRDPERGVAAALESFDVADRTGNPTARSMAHYALGLVLKKSEPDRALALLDQAAGLAASVRNFWWEGIALMEAAATRAVHAEAEAAQREFVVVLDHWDRVGDWTQQWLNIRYIVRLLVRLGADDEAIALHHALGAAGKPSPLDAAGLAALAEAMGGERFAAAARRGSSLPGAGVVALARDTLRARL